MKLKKLALILVTLLLAVNFMTAQETKTKPTVVTLPFDAKSVEQSEAEVLLEVLTNEIAGTGKVTVVDRSQIDKIKAQHNFQNSEWSNSEKVAKLGNALNANIVITGQLMLFKKDIVATFRMLDVNTMEIVSSATVRVKDTSEFFDKIPEIVKKLMGEIKNISMSSNITTSKTESSSVSTNVSTSSTNGKTYNIGDVGPGGGIIFYIENDRGLEVSSWLGGYNWNDAVSVARNYNGGGFYDWYLPNKEELNLIYQNLVKTGILDVSQGKTWYWSSSQHRNLYDAFHLNFSDGYQLYYSKQYICSVRAVRAF